MRVYLDNNATTAVRSSVVAAMVPWFEQNYGNASSGGHAFGWDAADGVEEARGHVADLVGARPSEIIFTGSATESINCALRGVSAVGAGAKNALTSATEHQAVLETCRLIGGTTALRIDIIHANRVGRISL